MGHGRVSQDIDRKKGRKEGALTLWRGEGGTTQDKKKANERGALTLWEAKKRRQVRHIKRGSGEGATYKLERAEKGTCRDMKRKQESGVHSPSEERRAGNQPGHGKKASERGALTSWKACGEEQVIKKKESDRGELTNWRVQSGKSEH